MQTTRVTIGSSRNYLAENEDLDALKTAVLEGCRSTGGFVDFRLADGQILSVLITANSSVTFEVVDVPEEEIEDDTPDSGRVHIDGDYWFE